MKDEIYSLFIKGAENDVKPTEELSAQEAEKIMERFRTEKNTKISHKKKLRPGITFVIAAAAAACIGTTAFAADRLGVFDRMKGVHERTVTDDSGNVYKAEKNDRIDYNTVSNAADVIEQPVTAANENITISAESVYSDGKKFIIGVTGSLNDGNKNNFGYVHLWDYSVEINGKMYCPLGRGDSDGEIWNSDGYMLLDEGTDNSFTGSLTFQLYDEKITEPTDVIIHFNDIACSEIYFTGKTYIGAAELGVPVTKLAEVKQLGTKYEEDGYSFTLNEITPVTVYAEYSSPYAADDPEHDIYVDVFDENGNSLTCINGRFIDKYTSDAEFRAPDTEKVTVKFYDKYRSDDNGSPLLVKEMNIDLK